MKHKGIFKRLSLLTLLLIACFTSAMAQSLYMEGFKINAGDTKTVQVALATSGYDVYGLQTDIVLSNGLYLDGDPVAVEGVMNTPSISCKQMDNKTTRVVMFSMDGEIFSGQKNVIQFKVGCTENFFGGNILLKNSRLTISNSGNEVDVPNYKAIITTDQEIIIPEGVWTIPTPTGLEFTTFTDDGDRYYLYNEAAKMFFASGNSWNTQASVRTFGYPFWVEATSEEDAPDGSYELWDDFYNPDRYDISGPHNCFTDDGGSTWVDHASQGNYSWAFEIVGNYVRFQNVALIADKPEYEGKYIGFSGKYDGDRNSSVLRMFAPDEEGVCVDWRAVTVESYEAFAASDDYLSYTNGVAAFFSAQKLRAAIEAAVPVYVNVADAAALYNNTSSTAEEMDAATAALTELTEVKARLKAAIESAEARGFTETAAYREELTNMDATRVEVESAISDLADALAAWSETHATWDNPGDMTSKITNPNFDNASYSGWLGDAPNMYGSGSHGPANVAEKWNATFDTYQFIYGLPVGIYALTAKTSWRGNWADMESGLTPAASLYVKQGEVETSTPFNYIWACYNTTPMAGSTYFGTSAGENAEEHEDGDGNMVTYYSPNDPSAFRLYEEAGFYDTQVMFLITDPEASLRIGVKNPALKGRADNWSLFDTFGLKFFGSDATSCQKYIEAAMKNFAEYVIEDGTLYTEAYLTAYQQAYSGEKTASTLAEVQAILDGINNAKAALNNNIALWKMYVKLLNEAKAMVANDEYKGIDETADLTDYLDFDSEDILEKVELTNEELETEAAKVTRWMQIIIDKSMQDVYEGKKMTMYIKNPDFEEDEDINSGKAVGWTIDAGTGGNITRGPLGEANKELMESALGKMNYCFEAWHRYNWDVWQEVKDLPVGIYELQVQGYVRCEMGGYTRGDDLVAPYTSPVYLYMNNAMSQFPSVYSECPADLGYEFTTVESWTTEYVNDNPYPNSMGGAAQCFGWGMYKTKAYGLIAKEGDTFRIGVKMNGNQDWWCIWDNFELTYHMPDNPDMIKPLLEEAIAKIDMTKPMGKDVYDRAALVVQQANDAIVANDGAAMFAALNATFDLNAAIIESVALFENLVAKAESLNEAIGESENQDAINEANALYSTIMTGCDNHTLTDAEAKEYIETIDVLFTMLKLPVNVNEASDSNPVDVTAVIKSYNFSDIDETINSSEGWNNPGNLGNDDIQRSALAMEFWQVDFDMYQDIIGLPEGTYMVSVDAWNRIGSNEDNYYSWLDDSRATLAYLYGMNGDGEEYDARVANMMKARDALMEDPGLDDVYGYELDGNIYYLPNSLVSGKGIIDMNPGVYTNKVIVKVGADGRLRIGIKKYDEVSNSWVVLDDFRLTYFGKNSSKKPGEVIDIDLASVINEANKLLGLYMQTSLQAELQQLVDTYKDATDASIMEEGYRLLTNCIGRVRENVDAYANLIDVISAVKQRLANGKNMDEDVVSEATAFVATAEAAYVARDINTRVANDYANKLYNLLEQLYAIFATVTLDQPGTLEEVLYDVAGDPWNLQGLKVKGAMNEDDLYLISNLYNLRLLDLAGTNLETLPNYIFEYRDNLEKVELPATLIYVGYGAFYGCWNLQSVTLHAAVPPYGYDRVNWNSGYNLYVPAISVQAYQDNYNWNNWNIRGIDELPEKFHAVTDYQVTWPEAEDYKPDMRIGQYGSGYDYVYGAVTVNAEKNNTVSLGQFTIVYDPNIELTRRYYWGYTDNSVNASLVNYAENMRADNVTVDYWVRRDRWTFFSLPFDAKVSEMGVNFQNTAYVIRKYDAAARAAGNMNETWVNMTADSVLHAGEGYILQSTVLEYEGDNRDYNGFFFNAMQTTNKNNIFASDDVEVPLKQFASEFAHNQNWNLIGNPYPCYYNIHGMQTNAPITVWNQGAQVYEAYSPLDDDYVLNPGEAFFVQRPVNESSIVFIEEGRQARRNQVNDNFVAGARRAEKTAARYVFNITINDGETTDRTRIVLNEEAKAGYEQDKDASKFMSLNDKVAQIYSVADTKYAINERPVANGEVKLGVHFGKQGTYTIALNTKVDAEVTLVDLLTGKETRLDGSEGYTFEASEGDTENRFVVRFAGGSLTGIQTIANDYSDNEKYYNLNGMQIEQPKKGLYLKNGKKVVVK